MAARDAYQADASTANRDALRSALDRLAEDLETFQGARDALSATFANTLTTGAALGIGLFTAGTATPVAVLVYSGIGAATQVVPRLVISGQTYDLAELPEDLLVGAVATGTAPFAFYRLAQGSTPVRDVFLGAMEGVANGGGLGFVTGALDAAVRQETWEEGFQLGVLRVGEAGVVSATIGAPLGGLIGGVARAIKGLPTRPSPIHFGSGSLGQVPGANRLTAYLLEKWKDDLAVAYPDLFGAVFGPDSNFTHALHWGSSKGAPVRPGVGIKNVNGEWKYELQLPDKATDYVVLEELYHIQQAAKMFPEGGPLAYEAWGKRVQMAETAIDGKTPEQIAAWAQESVENRQALEDLLAFLNSEKEAKQWVMNNPLLQAKYADRPDVWAAILEDLQDSLKTYTDVLPNVEAAIALLPPQGP